MRTVKITLGGNSYTLCYSTRVLLAVSDKFGSLLSLEKTMHDKDHAVEALEAGLWFLEQLINAGAKYERLMSGAGNEPAPLSLQQIRTMAPLIKRTVFDRTVETAISAGTKISIDCFSKRKQSKSMERSPEWFIYHGLRIGLSYSEAMDLPHGELLSLINAESIYQGVAKECFKNTKENVIPDWE